jgi:hypothetical protein
MSASSIAALVVFFDILSTNIRRPVGIRWQHSRGFHTFYNMSGNHLSPLTNGSLKGKRVGVCVSGGLDSKTVCKRLVEAGVDVLAFSGDCK